MANGYAPRHILLNEQAVNVGASTAYKGKAFNVTAQGALNLRIDALVGKVVGTVEMDLETSSGSNIWSSMAKTETSITASTNKTVGAIDNTTGVIACTGHSVVVGQAVSFTAATMPAGMSDKLVYYVLSIPTANSLTVGLSPDGPVVVPTDDGTTVLLTPISVKSIQLNIEISGDQPDLPLQSLGRVAFTTIAAESIQLLDCVVLQGL